MLYVRMSKSFMNNTRSEFIIFWQRTFQETFCVSSGNCWMIFCENVKKILLKSFNIPLRNWCKLSKLILTGCHTAEPTCWAQGKKKLIFGNTLYKQSLHVHVGSQTNWNRFGIQAAYLSHEEVTRVLLCVTYCSNLFWRFHLEFFSQDWPNQPYVCF